MSWNHPDRFVAPGDRYLVTPQFVKAKHYLTDWKCDLCGYTQTHDNQGPRLQISSWNCPVCKQQRNIISVMHRTNDGN